ncbi:MAG: hypothetical protein C3F07_19075 [Anaerolineales bacterium]|nr:STAS domain-containing protein [Anaerolineae bacterium]PWB69626.1 MAG: hypothetical protein C3F07_19075 [Anaerolineales bacterium]
MSSASSARISYRRRRSAGRQPSSSMLRTQMCSCSFRMETMEKLSLETDNTRSISVMKIMGQVDSETAPELDRALSGLLADGRNKIVLDLTGMDFMSSAGLRALVKALKGAQGSGGDVRLASVPETVQGILLTVGMTQMFKLFPTSEEAATGF